MSQVKHTMIFEIITGSDLDPSRRRIGGWSESWYAPTAFPTEFGFLQEKRSLMLPKQAAIVGQRFQQVDPVAKATLTSVRYPGPARYDTDNPQQALLCRAASALAANSRQVVIRCMPDDLISLGEYKPDGVWNVFLAEYLQKLIDRTWAFRGRDKSVTVRNVLAVGPVPTGNFAPFVTDGALTFDVGTQLRFKNVREDSTGRLISGTFQCVEKTDSLHGRIRGWNPLLTICGGGTVTPLTYIYPPVAITSVGRQVVKKVGRPFTSFRGRQAKKKTK